MPIFALPAVVAGGTSFTWTTSSGATAKTFTFQIPAGTYQSATWTLAYSYATYSGSGTYQLQITVPGSVFKDDGRSVTAAGSYSDTITAVVNDHISILNNYAGQTLSVTLLPVLLSGSASWTNLNITTFSLNLVAWTNTFGKRWSADALDEHVVLAWVEDDATCNTSSHAGLEALTGGSLATGWATQAQIAAFAEDVNLGTFTNGRTYLTYTKSDSTKTVKTTQYRTNDTFGAGDISSWSAETSVPTAVDPTDFHPTGGPFQPLGGTQYVVSHSNNQGGSYFIRTRDRLTCMNTRLVSVETDLVHGTFSNQIGPWTCVDGLGAAWTWRNNSPTTGGSTGNWNEYDGLLNRFAPNVGVGAGLSDAAVGRQYNRVVGAPLVASPVVCTRHNILAQVVYVNRYTRIVPFATPIFQITNNDAALGFTVTTPFSITVPTDSNSIGDVQFHLDWNYTERTRTPCTPVTGSFPASLTFSVPAMTGVPDPASNYGLQVWFTINFTFWPNAQNFQVRIGGDGGDPTSIYSRTYAVSGRGEYNNATQFYVCLTDLEAIWTARGGSITLPITYQGTKPDNFTIKSIVMEYSWYGALDFQGCSATANSVSNTAHTSLEVDFSTSSISTVANNSEIQLPASTAMVADMQAVAGSTYHANLVLAKGSSGGQPAAAYPYLVSISDAYATVSYNLPNYDFRMVTSRDFGRTWTFAASAAPITGLADLTAFNRLTTGVYSGPTLVASSDSILALWVENGAPKCLLTQDLGETWSS